MPILTPVARMLWSLGVHVSWVTIQILTTTAAYAVLMSWLADWFVRSMWVQWVIFVCGSVVLMTVIWTLTAELCWPQQPATAPRANIRRRED